MPRFIGGGGGSKGIDEDPEAAQAREDARNERLANQAPAPTEAPADTPTGEPVPTPDAGADEQASGKQRLNNQDASTEPPPTPGAPRPPRAVAKSNTPLGLSGTFAQVGSQAASAFRSPEFFTNRVIGGGQPMRFGSGSGSSLGGAFTGTPGGEPGPGRGLNEDDLMMAIRASQGGFMPFGG